MYETWLVNMPKGLDRLVDGGDYVYVCVCFFAFLFIYRGMMVMWMMDFEQHFVQV